MPKRKRPQNYGRVKRTDFASLKKVFNPYKKKPTLKKRVHKIEKMIETKRAYRQGNVNAMNPDYALAGATGTLNQSNYATDLLPEIAKGDEKNERNGTRITPQRLMVNLMCKMNPTGINSETVWRVLVVNSPTGQVLTKKNVLQNIPATSAEAVQPGFNRVFTSTYQTITPGSFRYKIMYDKTFITTGYRIQSRKLKMIFDLRKMKNLTFGDANNIANNFRPQIIVINQPKGACASLTTSTPFDKVSISWLSKLSYKDA